MRTLKVTLQYDGTEYVGWQRQDNGVSIQAVLEGVLGRIEGANVTVHGAGRTDAGVHALAQVASLEVNATLDVVTFARALNATLPADIRVLLVEEMPPGFHARFSAHGKVYEYRIINAPIISPFAHRYAWHIVPPLDLDAMREGSACLVGTHDFSAFQGAGSVVMHAERTVRSLSWQEGGGYDLPFVMHISGDGFLRHMVRNIVGTLVEVGLGRWPSSAVAEILASRDRTNAGLTAPAHGLFLVQVVYPVL